MNKLRVLTGGDCMGFVAYKGNVTEGRVSDKMRRVSWINLTRNTKNNNNNDQNKNKNKNKNNNNNNNNNNNI